MPDFKFDCIVFCIVAMIMVIVLSTGVYRIEKKQNEKAQKAQKDLISNIESNTRSIVEKDYQIQAISNNFAHWEVNLNGETTFKWNTKEY